ncbi:alpha carbonic anhydrase [Catenaria anguillulae PL171]|uniref:carbonic anhydrase n=1 Tax=Catenaria anguillulae PL171 TaxID=765915 RepID=A0A1Y2H9D7_9FUNG|nr:alpha carbonic anhydrase [Catenaria anguillulae PL171]
MSFRLSVTSALVACALVAIFPSASLSAPVAGAPEFGYEALNGPTRWAQLSSEFRTCDTGRQQSPVNLNPSDVKTNVFPTDFALPSFNQFEVENKGHTIQFTPKDGNSRGMTVDGSKFTLQQFHIHTPSEHRIAGKHMAAEIHLVHESADKKVSVVGVMVEETPQDNPLWSAALSNLPAEPEAKVALNAVLDTSEFVNVTKSSVFTYMGSLTTPPCSEGVRWFIPATTVKMSIKQLDTFVSMIGYSARPTMFNENVKEPTKKAAAKKEGGAAKKEGGANAREGAAGGSNGAKKSVERGAAAGGNGNGAAKQPCPPGANNNNGGGQQNGRVTAVEEDEEDEE